MVGMAKYSKIAFRTGIVNPSQIIDDGLIALSAFPILLLLNVKKRYSSITAVIVRPMNNPYQMP
jgi:hypothetical protein